MAGRKWSSDYRKRSAVSEGGATDSRKASCVFEFDDTHELAAVAETSGDGNCKGVVVAANSGRLLCEPDPVLERAFNAHLEMVLQAGEDIVDLSDNNGGAMSAVVSAHHANNLNDPGDKALPPMM